MFMNENAKKMANRVHASMDQQLERTGVATPVQVLMDLDMLTKKDYDNWRFGKADYLERVCKANLHRLAAVMREVRLYARNNNLKPSWTFYKQWGQKGSGPTTKLRFSKSGNEDIERHYATHYVDTSLVKKVRTSVIEEPQSTILQQSDHD
jgi:hypothetical protein